MGQCENHLFCKITCMFDINEYLEKERLYINDNIKSINFGKCQDREIYLKYHAVCLLLQLNAYLLTM